jgi:hypothetical protein
VLVATSGPGDSVSFPQFQSFIRTLYDAADRTPDLSWLVKLHKKDREEHYQQIRPEGHPRVRLVRGEFQRDGLSIFDYLRSARALVTISSTAAVDAMAVDVPVIAVDVWPPGKGLTGVEFLERGCTMSVRSAAELAEAANRAWAGQADPQVLEAARTYAAEHFANRGRAAQAVAEQLVSLSQPCLTTS